MYSVLCTRLATRSGKDIVRAHSGHRDTQAILVALEDYYHSSTKAGIDSGALLTYITSARLGPNSTWNGSTEDFILNCVNKLHLYKANIDDAGKRFRDDIKKTMLENAVQLMKGLACIKEHTA